MLEDLILSRDTPENKLNVPIVLPKDLINELMLVDFVLEPCLEDIISRPKESGMDDEDEQNLVLLQKEFFPRVRHIYRDAGKVDAEWVRAAIGLSNEIVGRRQSSRYDAHIRRLSISAGLTSLLLWKASTVLLQIVDFLNMERVRRGLD